jgi:SpoVK/Ycf46/Vps4 family AAA+-type ATPase
VRLRDDQYTFLSFRPPRVEARHAPEAESAARTVASFLAAAEPGEHLGLLWHGPPGNGKTSLVRRLLRECEGVTRLWVDPSAMNSENLEETLALLARILRSLGEEGAALVVFEDIDLVSGNREASPIRSWLSALDGVEQFRCRIVFLGLTNLSPQELDPAVVRPARLGDLIVEFGPPDRKRRQLILGDHLGGRLDALALDALADRSQGWSGAEVELMCRRARWAQREAGCSDVTDWVERLVAQIRPRTAAAAVGFCRGTGE